MIINLNGTLIDTKQIQSITEIIPPNNWKFDDNEDSGDDEIEWMERFIIKFIGGRAQIITQFDLKKDLIETHKSLVDIWKANQSDIPKLGF